MLTPTIFIANTTTTTPDTASTASSQLGFVYPIPIDEDTVDSNELTIDFQTTATIITDDSEAVSRTHKNTSLSNASVTTARTPHVETNATDVPDMDLSMPNDLASRKNAPNSQNISTLDDKNNKPADINDARLLNETPGEFLFCLFSFTAQPCRTANNSGVRFMS
jgi:autotransporter translocation and assembly factor TamB